MSIKIYGSESCVQCADAKQYLESKNVAYEYVDVFKDQDAIEKLISRGFSTLPVIMTSNEKSYSVGFDVSTIDELIKEENYNARYK